MMSKLSTNNENSHVGHTDTGTAEVFSIHNSFINGPVPRTIEGAVMALPRGGDILEMGETHLFPEESVRQDIQWNTENLPLKQMSRYGRQYWSFAFYNGYIPAMQELIEQRGLDIKLEGTDDNQMYQFAMRSPFDSFWSKKSKKNPGSWKFNVEGYKKTVRRAAWILPFVPSIVASRESEVPDSRFVSNVPILPYLLKIEAPFVILKLGNQNVLSNGLGGVYTIYTWLAQDKKSYGSRSLEPGEILYRATMHDKINYNSNVRGHKEGMAEDRKEAIALAAYNLRNAYQGGLPGQSS